MCLGKGTDENTCLVGTLRESNETEDVTTVQS